MQRHWFFHQYTRLRALIHLYFMFLFTQFEIVYDSVSDFLLHTHSFQRGKTFFIIITDCLFPPRSHTCSRCFLYFLLLKIKKIQYLHLLHNLPYTSSCRRYDGSDFLLILLCGTEWLLICTDIEIESFVFNKLYREVKLTGQSFIKMCFSFMSIAIHIHI